MAITYDKRAKCYRFQFNRVISGRRCRHSKLLPRGWTQAQADAFDRQESAKLYAIATGVQRRDPLIVEAVTLYLEDKKGRLKSYKQTSEHLSAIAWAFDGKPMSELPQVAKAIREWPIAPGKQLAPATIKNRLACLKAACRWAWKKHGLTEHDPTTRMLMPEVNNERHSYKGRREMLMAARACKNWYGQIAIRVGFYSGMRLGEQMRATVEGGAFVLQDKDTKNGDRRSIPVHPKIKHLAKFYPLPGPKITMQRAWERARDAVGLQGSTFHDLRHWAASEMVNNGVDLYTVGAILGHRDARSTKRYSHLNTKTLAKAVEKIGKKDET